MTWNDAAVVNTGVGLLEEALTGKPLNIIGAGGGAGRVDSAALLVQTGLVDRRQDVTVADIQDEPGGGKKILLRITSKGVIEEYNMTQIGIMGQCGDKGPYLFALLQDLAGISIPTETAMPDFLLEFYVITAVSGNVQFTYTVDPTALVSVGDLTAAINQTEDKLSNAAASEVAADDDAFAMVPADGGATKRVTMAVIRTAMLGETSDTAYRGDRGKAAYDHSQGTGNPHRTKAAEIAYTDNKGLGAVTVQDAVDAAVQLLKGVDQAAATALAAANAAKLDAAGAVTAAGNAQQTAEAALEAIAKLAHTIDATPSQNGGLTFTGREQSPVWNSYNPETLVLGGVIKGTNAGTYTATFTPVEGYTWSDNTATARSVTWSIGRAAISTVPTQSGSLIYTGGSQSPDWSNYDSAKLSLGGQVNGTNAGSYNATFTPTANYQWTDGTTAGKTAAWSIGRAAISTVPTQSGSLTYTGSSQTPDWSNYDSAKMTLGGSNSGTNAGSYNATFTPTANFKWSDGSTAAKTVAWSIGKAAGTLSLDKTSLTLTNGALTGTIAVTRAGNGTVTASSNNTGAATVSVSGTTVTVTGKGYGSATITVSVAAGSNHNAPANKTCGVTAKVYNTVLNANTWAQIREASEAGTAASAWSVGDTKGITINGQVGNTAFSNLNINAFILGFNHNSAHEGSNRIHFQIGKISNKLVALADSKYGTSVSTTGYFSMNISNTNSGGWSASQMRNSILGSPNSPNQPIPNSLVSCLPADLRAVMRAVNKFSDNVGSMVNTASCVTNTSDYLFLLSEFEYHGATTCADSVERNYQVQYDYYKAGNSKVHYKHNATGATAYVWCRSVNSGNSYYFCLVYTGGSAGNSNASVSYGVAPGFCV